MEYDGVVVEDTSDLQRKAWQQIAEEEGKRTLPQFALQRAEGMKNDQASGRFKYRLAKLQGPWKLNLRLELPNTSCQAPYVYRTTVEYSNRRHGNCFPL